MPEGEMHYGQMPPGQEIPPPPPHVFGPAPVPGAFPPPGMGFVQGCGCCPEGTFPLKGQMDPNVWKRFQQLMSHQGREAGARNFRERETRVILQEKEFGRVDKLGGDPTKLRGWVFDLLTVVNQLEPSLSKELHGILSRDAKLVGGGLGENWEASRFGVRPRKV